MASCATTRSEPAAHAVEGWLGRAAHRLGVADPRPYLGAVLQQAFPLPLADDRYARNALLPGMLPIEASFSEIAPTLLRLDLEPGGPLVSGARRRALAVAAARRIARISALSGSDRLGACGGPAGDPLTFGAFLGVASDVSGPAEVKVYFELPIGAALRPSALGRAATELVHDVPGAAPLLYSIAAGRHRHAERIYLVCRDELRLLDLEQWMVRHELGHRVAALLTTVLTLEGRFVLPPRSAVLGIRHLGSGWELKVELLVPAPERALRIVEQLLRERPAGETAFQRWVDAVAPSPRAVSVVSVRVTPDTGPRLTVYARPLWAGEP